MHPPVGRQKPATPTRQLPPPSLPSLPSGVSIRPVTGSPKPGPVAAGRPVAGGHIPRKPQQRPAAQPRPRPAVQPRPRQVAPAPPQARQDMFSFTPCSPFCPGVTGIPELECTQCHSLFHPKCVNIPAWQVASIQQTFRCKVRLAYLIIRSLTYSIILSYKPILFQRCAGSNNRTEVINLD